MYTGRRFDYETGLYYYRARYYNPYIGRFLQKDPIGYGAGMNLYAYCGNNPLVRTDPTGKIPWGEFFTPESEVHNAPHWAFLMGWYAAGKGKTVNFVGPTQQAWASQDLEFMGDLHDGMVENASDIVSQYINDVCDTPITITTGFWIDAAFDPDKSFTSSLLHGANPGVAVMCKYTIYSDGSVVANASFTFIDIADLHPEENYELDVKAAEFEELYNKYNNLLHLPDAQPYVIRMELGTHTMSFKWNDDQGKLEMSPGSWLSPPQGGWPDNIAGSPTGRGTAEWFSN